MIMLTLLIALEPVKYFELIKFQLKYSESNILIHILIKIYQNLIC